MGTRLKRRMDCSKRSVEAHIVNDDGRGRREG